MDVASLQVIIKTQGVEAAQRELDKLGGTAGKAEKSVGGLASSMQTLANIAIVGYLAKATKSAIELNAQFESMQIGIATLISVNAKNTTSLGKAVTSYEKFTMAQMEAAEAVELLRKANAETPATLKELTEGFQAAIGPALKYGMTINQTINYAKLMTQAAASMGMPMQQLAQEMRAILTGNIDMNAAVARNLGITNEQITLHKKQGDMYEFLMSKLQDFEAAGKSMANSWVGITSNIEDTMDSMRKNASSGLFNVLKEDIKELNSYFISNASKIEKEVSSWLDTFYSLGVVMSSSSKNIVVLYQDVDKLSTVLGLNAKEDGNLGLFKNSILGLNILLDSMYVGLHNSIELASRLAVSSKNAFEFISSGEFEKAKNAFDDMLNPKGIISAEELLNRQIDMYKKLLNVKTEFSKESKKEEVSNPKGSLVFGGTVEETTEEIRKKEQLLKEWQKRKIEIATNIAIAEQDELSKPFILLEAKYKEDLETFKGVKGAKERLTLEYNENVKLELEDMTEKFNKEEAKKLKTQQDFIAKSLEITLSQTDKIIEKYTEIFSQSELFSESQIKKLIEKMNYELDNITSDIEIKANITLDPSALDGTAKAIASISKGMDNIIKEQNQYEKNNKKLNLTSKEIAENENNHIQSQIYGYASIAGAMSSMFEQGSKDAAAFRAIESGLAVIAGVRAILTAGSGDPYTAIPRMVATAAMVAATLQQAGIAFGTNVTNVSSSYDAISALEANTGIGSTLGDTKAQSESIMHSLEVVEDFAKPQFSVLSQMNKYLASIDQKLGGVTSLLIQSGGFAVGAGFTPTSSVENPFSLKSLPAYNTMSKLMGGMTGTSLMDNIFGTSLGGDAFDLFSGATLTNKILSGLLGTTTVSQTITDSGIFFADQLITQAIDDFMGSAYQTIQTTTTKKSWFSKSTSNAFSTIFEDLGEETQRQFTLVLKNLYDLTLSAGDALDVSSESIINSLSSFVVSVGKISLLDKTGEEIQESLVAIFGKIGDDISRTVFPELIDFQQVGEGLFTTMSRVSVGMEEAEYYINRLGVAFEDLAYTDISNKQGNVGFEALYQSIVKTDGAIYGFNNGVLQMLSVLTTTAEELYGTYKAFEVMRLQMVATGKDAQYLTSSVVLGAGSIGSLSSGFDAYIENFLSSEEQLAYKTKEMNSVFEAIGYSLPSSIDSFVLLINSLDLTTAAGQETYGRLISISGAFHEFSQQIDELSKPILDNFNEINNINLKISEIQKEKLLIEQGISEGNLTSLKAQKSGIQTVMDMAKSMRDKLISASNISGLYKTVLESARIDFSKGDYSSDNISRLGKVSELYADSLQKYSLSEADYQFGVLKIASEIESITGKTTTLADVEREIERVTKALKLLEPTLDSQLDALYAQKDVYVTQTDRQIATLEALMGANSPLVQMLKVALESAKTGSVGGATLLGSNVSGTLADVASIYTSLGLNQYQTDTSGYEYWANQVNTGVIAPSQLESAIKASAEQILGTKLGFANGGYTGNIGVNDIAGVVHGQEYVVNAQTTKDLGLNGSGGAFAEMVAELASLRKLMVKLVSDNTKQLSTQRAILGEKVAI